MFQTKHDLTEGEKKCLEEYEKNKSQKPRKNLIRLVRHINMLNPLPDEKSWEYIFFDRQLSDEQVDFALKLKTLPGWSTTSVISACWNTAAPQVRKTG